MRELLSKIISKFKKQKSKNSFDAYSYLERDIRQKRVNENWTINMLSEYYGYSENFLRTLLDHLNIK
jgi:hypothetical protein